MNYIIYILILLLNFSCDSGESASGPPSNIYGCMDSASCNYNPNATVDDQSCWQPNDGCTCDNGQGASMDCNNDCGGSALYDNCGVCSGGSTGISVNECGIITDGCQLPINTIGFVPKKNDEEWGRIIYNVDYPIAGFQFNMHNIVYTPHPQLGLFYGGEAEFEQFAFSQTTPGSPILAFNLLGNIISEACGDLTNISYENDFNSNTDQVYIDSIVFSDHNGNSVNMTYYDTCTNDTYDCNGICSGEAYIDACSNCTEGLTGEDDCLDGYTDCYGNIGIDADVNVVADCFGVCGGDHIIDCLGECGGSAALDQCGVCNGDGSSCSCPSGIFDCAGVCDGSAVVDCAGVCNGDSINDCAGVCGGTASEDCAGICNGSSTTDCLGQCNGSATIDQCGVCDGDGSSCVLTACDIDQNTLYLYQINGNDYSIFYNSQNSIAIGGFQFKIKSNDTPVNITQISGGDAALNNFTLQYSNELVLGFSFIGGIVAPGCGILTNVTLEDSANNITDIVVSDPLGNPIPFQYYNDN